MALVNSGKGSGMKRPLHMVAAVACASLIAIPAHAKCDLSRVVGYTLVAAKTVTHYIEEGRGRNESKDGFEGCDFDRIIVFEDGTGVRCAGFGYQFAFRPTAYVFARDGNMKMCVDDELYDITAIRG